MDKSISATVQDRARKLARKVDRFWRDSSGNYAIITALLSPVLIGATGLATEGGLWYYTHQRCRVLRIRRP